MKKINLFEKILGFIQIVYAVLMICFGGYTGFVVIGYGIGRYKGSELIHLIQPIITVVCGVLLYILGEKIMEDYDIEKEELKQTAFKEKRFLKEIFIIVLNFLFIFISLTQIFIAFPNNKVILQYCLPLLPSFFIIILTSILLYLKTIFKEKKQEGDCFNDKQ